MSIGLLALRARQARSTVSGPKGRQTDTVVGKLDLQSLSQIGSVLCLEVRRTARH
jgi:hypothetical protein